VTEDLFSVEDFDSGLISGDGVLGVFHLSEASFSESSSHLVIPYSRPTRRRRLPSASTHFLFPIKKINGSRSAANLSMWNYATAIASTANSTQTTNTAYTA
jgi:hypothetical protein